MKEILIIAALFLAAASSNGDTIARGERVFNKCKMCHSLEEGKNKVGPSLYGLFDRKIGTVEKYRYSKAMKNLDFVWDGIILDVFIAKPKLTIPKTKMSFRGIRKREDRKALIEYLYEATKPKEE
ncbi:hypothetical protein LCGC14_0746570 [marine sediment metagenome]|uniref:Cytochrome c domain-containing protein n=1 Tax=marine sediment metagenome TaxID=412755 RepID=A0A0F9QQ30_9ZZZZ